MRKIGFACKFIDHPHQINGIKPKDDCKKYNTGSTTVAWLNRQTKDKAEEKLWDLMIQNIESIRKLVEKVGSLHENLRMVRLSSDLLPVYTEPTWRYFWQQSHVRDYASSKFKVVGDLARALNVRLSFHPGQFCVLASENQEVVQRSIEEFEYHVDMARWMGYGSSWHDHGFKINVHIAGRQGPQGIINALLKLSTEARNLITIENEEISWGLDDVLELEKHVAIVLDIHHHWCHTGEYIEPNDDRVLRVIDSWRGVRPVLHYSVSREDVLVGHDETQRPNFQVLLEQKHKVQKLRAHSDFYWNKSVNQWALSFLDKFDIMTESKGKNLSSFALFKELS